MLLNETAIDRIIQSLMHQGDPYFDHFENLTEALEVMATDPDTQYHIGSRVCNKALEEARDGSNDQRKAHWSIRMLGKSGHKEAIEPLKKMLSYDNGEGSDHYNDLIAVAKEASEALNKMIGTNSDLQLQAGLAGCDSPWTIIHIWATHMLVKSGREEAITPLKVRVRKFEETLKSKNIIIVYEKEIEEAIVAARKALMELLSKVLLSFNQVNTINHDEAIKALEEIATDPDSQYNLGLKVLKSDNIRGLSYSGIIHWGIKMLGKSGRKDAIELIINKRLLNYDEWDHPEVALSVVEAARETLNELVGADSELQLQVGLEGCDSSWIEVNKWAAQMLAKSGRVEAIKPLKDMLKKLEDKLENSLKDKILSPSHSHKFREAIETTLKALKDLGAN